jgi:hypothetical protein
MHLSTHYPGFRAPVGLGKKTANHAQAKPVQFGSIDPQVAANIFLGSLTALTVCALWYEDKVGEQARNTFEENYQKAVKTQDYSQCRAIIQETVINKYLGVKLFAVQKLRTVGDNVMPSSERQFCLQLLAEDRHRAICNAAKKALRELESGKKA